MGKDQISLFQMRFSFTFSVSETGMHLTHSRMPSTSWQHFFPLMAQIMVHHRYQRHFRFDEMDRYLTGSREVRHPRQRDWHACEHRGSFPAGLAGESLPARAGPAEHRSVPGLGTPHAATPGAGTAEPAPVTRSRGPQPERSPCRRHQRRPESGSEGPAQPTEIIQTEQRRGATRHAALRSRKGLGELGDDGKS